MTRPSGPADSVRSVCPSATPGQAEAAESCLRRKGYLALRAVACECRGGVLTLRGRLPSYHLKQLAQAAVAGTAGVLRIVNAIEVCPAPRRN